jgi:hypothetical protein
LPPRRTFCATRSSPCSSSRRTFRFSSRSAAFARFLSSVRDSSVFSRSSRSPRASCCKRRFSRCNAAIASPNKLRISSPQCSPAPSGPDACSEDSPSAAHLTDPAVLERARLPGPAFRPPAAAGCSFEPRPRASAPPPTPSSLAVLATDASSSDSSSTDDGSPAARSPGSTSATRR